MFWFFWPWGCTPRFGRWNLSKFFHVDPVTRALSFPFEYQLFLGFWKLSVLLFSVLQWLRRGNGECNGTPLQYSCLENPMDRGAWEAAVHGVTKVGHDWATSLSLFTFTHWRRNWQPTPVFLPGESQGQQSLVGCSLWGRTESDTTDWSDLAAAVLVAQSSPTLYDPMDCSLPGPSIHGILQARIVDLVAIPFSRGSSQPRDWTWVSWLAGRFFTVWATREAKASFESKSCKFLPCSKNHFATSEWERVLERSFCHLLSPHSWRHGQHIME